MRHSAARYRLERLERRLRSEAPVLAPPLCPCEDDAAASAYEHATEPELLRAIGILKAAHVRPARPCPLCGRRTIYQDLSQVSEADREWYLALEARLEQTAGAVGCPERSGNDRV